MAFDFQLMNRPENRPNSSIKVAAAIHQKITTCGSISFGNFVISNRALRDHRETSPYPFS